MPGRLINPNATTAAIAFATATAARGGKAEIGGRGLQT